MKLVRFTHGCAAGSSDPAVQLRVNMRMMELSNRELKR
jgi:hypothetical protein